MSRIPCRKCPGCGQYHDVSVLTCATCGSDLNTVPAHLIETDEIPGDSRGRIDETVIAYVQNCSACGALNFTYSAAAPVGRCFNCKKVRVASVTPVPYTAVGRATAGEEDGAAAACADGKEDDRPEKADRTSDLVQGSVEDVAKLEDLIGNIRKAVGDTETPAAADENDGARTAVDWSGVLGGQSRSEITLTAIRYGDLSFTIKAEEAKKYVLGRTANQSAFLQKDARVGNEHCTIHFRDGFWVVKDHSQNGTFVNAEDIGENGEHVLHDGDILQLGHHFDSMAFRITIRK